MNLTIDSIKQLTNERSFVRGEKYYKQGRVIDYIDQDNVITANVIGTDKYMVKIDLNTLVHSCNCLAFDGDQFCKHEIAVLLTKISGEIKSETEPEIKQRHSTENSHLEIYNLSNLISRLELSELQNLVTELINTNIDVRNYFIAQLIKPDNTDLKALETRFRRLFRSINNSVGWRYYSNQLDEIYQDSLQLFQYLAISNLTCKFLLDQAYWLDKKLESIDDSDGVVQCLQDELIRKAVSGIKQGDISLSDIYKFTSKESSFDFATKIIESIFENVNDSAFIKPLLQKLEVTLYRSDKDFGHASRYMRDIFFHHLPKFDPDKFESLAVELYKNDNGIKKELLNYYFHKKEYTKFVEVYGDSDNLCFWGFEELEKALKELHEIEKLKKLYSKLLILGYGRKYLNKLYKIIYVESGDNGWIKFRNQLINNVPSKTLKADLCLLTKDYDRAVEVLLKKPEINYTGRIEDQAILNFANKFTIISPKHAIILYEFLFEEEFETIKGKKNSYNLILYFSDNLLRLGDLSFLKRKAEYIYQNLPNKKKLVESFKDMLKN